MLSDSRRHPSTWTHCGCLWPTLAQDVLGLQDFKCKKLTCLLLASLYRTHRPNDDLQYSMRKYSANSCPCPLPNRPCVSVWVMIWSAGKSICRYSRTSLLICAFGHQAPPFFSCRILKPKKKSLKFRKYRRPHFSSAKRFRTSFISNYALTLNKSTNALIRLQFK